ncbi:MAG: RNA polymerase sigma factor, partial [Gemmatimonadota bacterium]
MTELKRRPHLEVADEDAADVALAASGHRRAFERLYRRHVARVHGLARRMIGREGADDLTQEIFVRAWEKLDGFRGEAAFGSWLYKIGIHLALAERRTAGARRSRFVTAGPAVDRAIAPRRTPELAMDFEKAIERLPDGAQQVFVLHDVEGYRHREIAEMMEIAVGTSKSQLHRARAPERDRAR